MGYTIYTDGGCDRNPGGHGGCGVVIINGEEGKEERHSFAYDSTTNNRMEMRALIHALLLLPEYPGKIIVYSDSQYVLNTLKGMWKRKANLDLWKKLDELVAGKDITYRWVKGHNGNMYNEICDELATAGINNPDKLHDEGYEGTGGFEGPVVHAEKPKTKKGAMSVAIDLPAAYNKHADISVRPAVYAENMSVSSTCAAGIISFYKNGRNSFKAYQELKTGGRDKWSVKSKDELIHEFGQNIWEMALGVIGDEKSCEAALRWYGRGLSLSDAIRKTLVDMEVRENAVKAKNSMIIRAGIS